MEPWHRDAIRDRTLVADVYRAAADLLLLKGWGRGSSVGVNGVLCMTAAVNRAAGRQPSRESPDLLEHLATWLVKNRAADLIEAYTVLGYDVETDLHVHEVMNGQFWRHRHHPLSVIQTWNDANTEPGAGRRKAARSREQVVAALREAAADLESTEGASL